MKDRSLEIIFKIAQKKLAKFGVKEVGVNPSPRDGVPGLLVQVESVREDIPNAIEIEGVVYDIVQSGGTRVEFCAAGDELKVPTTKPVGERLQNWDTGQKSSDNRILRAMVFEDDCNGLISPAPNQTKTRPIKCGTAISVGGSKYGTLGCLAVDDTDGTLVGITNAHVLTDKFLIHSKAEGLGFGGALVDKLVRQGDLSQITSWGSSEEIGIVKRYFPVGLEYESSPLYKDITRNDEADLDVALIALKESVVDENSWKLAGIEDSVGTVPFNDNPYTFASEREFDLWLYDSYWAGYTKDVGGGVDSYNTPEEAEMITSSATTGPNPGVTDPKWRIWGPVAPKEFPFQNQRDDSGTIEIEVKGLVAMARQQNADRYKDFDEKINRGEWYCAGNIIPGDSGSVLFAYFDAKTSGQIPGYEGSITAGWKAVGIFFATEFDEQNTPTRAFLMPMWKIARQMQVSPWDGNLTTTTFADNDGVFDTELKHVRGKSSVYQYKEGDKSYFQVGGVPGPDNIGDRDYVNAAESFPTARVSEDFAGRFENFAPLENWLNLSSINIDIPSEGSYDDTNTLANANAIWFKLNNLKVNPIEVPAEILNPLNGACFIDVAVIHEDSYENLEDVYFLDEELRKTKVYASTPIIESYGQDVDDFVVNYAKQNLGAGVRGTSKNLISSNLSRARYVNGGQSAFVKFEGKNLDINEDVYYAGYRPWKTTANGLRKGEAKADPKNIESWISAGAKIVIVAYFVGNSNGIGGATKTLIKKLDVSAITNTSSKIIVNSQDVGSFPPLPATTPPTTETINYTITENGSKYFIEGGAYSTATTNPQLTFEEGNTYVFDWSAAPTHPFEFSKTENGTRNGGVEYLYNVTKDSTAKTISITINHNTSSDDANVSLYYYCSAHKDMGNGIVVNIDEANKPEMILTINPTLAVPALSSNTLSDAQKRTVLVPIFKTGSAGAKINWGDGTSTDIPANWDAITDDNLTYNQVYDAWGYTANGNMPTNLADTNVVKLCHKYSTTNSTTMTITGEVLLFGNPFSGNDITLHNRTMPEQFSSRINSISDFPYWPDCDYIQTFRYSNIGSWSVSSVFKGFRKLEYFIGKVTNGGSSIDSSTCNGMLDNWDFSNFQSEYFQDPSSEKIIFDSSLSIDDDIVVGKTTSANPANINSGNIYEMLKTICSNNSKKLIIGNNIDFSLYSTGDMSWFAAGSDIDFSLSTANPLDFNGGIIPPYAMLNYLVGKGYAKVGALVNSGKGFFKNTTVNQAIMNGALKHFTFSKGASYENMFLGATLSSDLSLSALNFPGADCTYMFGLLEGENFELTFPEINNPASIKDFLAYAKVKKINGLDEMTISPSTDTSGAFQALETSEDFEIGKWNLSERQIYNYTHEMILQTYDEDSPDPTKVSPSRSFVKWKDFPLDLRVQTGTYSYISNEGNCGIRFYARNPGPTAGEQTISIVEQQASDSVIVNGLQSITINLSGSATSRTVADVIALVQSNSDANLLIDCQAVGGLTNTAAFAAARLDKTTTGTAASVGQLILPENLKFLQEIVSFYEFVLGGSAGTDSFVARQAKTTTKRPVFPIKGKYAIFVNAAQNGHPTYTDSSSTTRTVPHELELYQSSDGVYGNASLVPNQETFTKKYSYGEADNAGDTHELRTISRGAFDGGENSYWMIIDIDPRRFSLDYPHWKYKSKLDNPSGGAAISLSGFSNNANNYFNNDDNHIINVANGDSDADGILDIDEIGDEILDGTSGDSKITITYADSSEYSAIAASNASDWGIYDPDGESGYGHEIASNKVGVSIPGIGPRGITIDWGGGNLQNYSTSEQGIIIKDYGNSTGDKTIIIEGEITKFANDWEGRYNYGTSWRNNQEDQDVRVFLGSQFRMKSFKYKGGGSLLYLGQMFQIGANYSESYPSRGKTAYDPTNSSVLDGTTSAGLPKTNYQVDVDFSEFQPRRLRSLNAIFANLYTHDLDLSNLDFSKIKDFTGMFSAAIITGTLKLPAIDDSLLEMTEARHFSGDISYNALFGPSYDSPTRQALKLAALKKAFINGSLKKLNWGSGDNSAFKDWDNVVPNNPSYTRQMWRDVGNQYRKFDSFLQNAVINKISYGDFKPILTDQQGHLSILGREAAYISELNLDLFKRFPIGETQSSSYNNSIAQTKKPNDSSDCEVTVDYLSLGEMEGEESYFSGPHGRTINIKIFKGKMHAVNIADMTMDVRYESLILPNQTHKKTLEYETSSGAQEKDILVEASDTFLTANGNIDIRLNLKHSSSYTTLERDSENGLNTTYNFFQLQLNIPTGATLQEVIDFIEDQDEIKSCTPTGNGKLDEGLVFDNQGNWPSGNNTSHFTLSNDMKVRVTVDDTQNGSATGIILKHVKEDQYSIFECHVGLGVTKQELIDEVNEGKLTDGTSHHFAAQFPPSSTASANEVVSTYKHTWNSVFSGKGEYRWTGGGVDPVTVQAAGFTSTAQGWSYNHLNYVGTESDLTSYQYAYGQGVPINRLVRMLPGNTYVFDWSDVNDKLLFSSTRYGTHNGGEEYSDHPITVDTSAKTTTVVCDKFLYMPDEGYSHFINDHSTSANLFGYFENKTDASVETVHLDLYNWVFKGQNGHEKFGLTSGVTSFNSANFSKLDSGYFSFYLGVKYVLDYSALLAKTGCIMTKLEIVGDSSGADWDTRQEKYPYLNTVKNAAKKLEIDLRNVEIPSYNNPFDYGTSSNSMYSNSFEIGNSAYGLALGDSTRNSHLVHGDIDKNIMLRPILPPSVDSRDVQDSWWVGSMWKSPGVRFSKVTNQASLDNWRKVDSTILNDKFLNDNKFAIYQDNLSALFAGYNDQFKVDNIWGGNLGSDSMTEAEAATYGNKQAGAIGNLLKLKLYKYTGLTDMSDWGSQYVGKTI